MRLAIMQPYFLPYIGYWQLLAAVDRFVIYDRIKYTKKGWINRNRFLLNGRAEVFSLPLRKASDDLDVVDRWIAPDFEPGKLLAQWQGAYRRAPHFAPTMALMETVLACPSRNLFEFIHHSVKTVAGHLGIETEIVVSSTLPPEATAPSGAEKVMAICGASGATRYINPIGGTELYDKHEFARSGIELVFLRALPLEYPQFGAPHVPWLSIVDVLMFNPLAEVRGRLLRAWEAL
jgi:hypothetical protein